jgi:hypothetical protein
MYIGNATQIIVGDSSDMEKLSELLFLTQTF